MSKRIMNEIFNECNQLGIDVHYSATDSLLIDTDKVVLLQDRIGDGLGQLHVEASGDAIVIKQNLYYLNDNHYRCAGTPHKVVEESGDIRQWFLNRLD
jgi:hypothetical protein